MNRVKELMFAIRDDAKALKATYPEISMACRSLAENSEKYYDMGYKSPWE
jgi:hypothetical protein